MLNIVTKYPLSAVLSICLLFFTSSIFFSTQTILQSEIHYWIIALFFMLMCRNIYALFTISVVIALSILGYLFGIRSNFYLFIAESITLVLFVLLNKKHQNIIIFYIIAEGFLVHLFYIQNTPISLRQHDLYGVILYMDLIIKDGINWSGFNPWYGYYLFHQPLHFIITGLIYRFEKVLQLAQMVALENLQYISLFYVTGASIMATRILKLLHIQNQTFYGCLLLFVFNPTLTLLSGYISNDAPLLFWSVTVFYFILRWYEECRSNLIIKAALCFAAGTLTKLSMLLFVPAFILLFLHKLYTTAQKRQILQQISLFVIITVPLSLIWVFRNHILFDMPFYHIPDTSPQGQNFFYLTLFERLSDFSMVLKPFINVPYDVDANIWLEMIKTELFGEWNLSLLNQNIFLPAFILYSLNILLKLSALCGCGYLIYKQITDKKEVFPVCFFVVMYFTIWGYSFKYALDYPYVCSNDYRLFSQLILFENIILGLSSRSRLIGCFFFSLALIYALLSTYIYINI